MKLKNKIGCSTNSYHEFGLETALKGIAAAGFEYVELTAVKDYTEHVRPERMNRKDIENVLGMLRQYGLKPMSLSGHSDLTDKNGLELFKKRIDFANAIGVGIVNTGPGEIETESGKDRFFGNIGEVAEYAALRKVTIALETHGDLLGTGKKSAEVVKKIGIPNVRINYDTGNVIFYGGVRPEEDILEALPFIAHIHLKDKIGGVKIWDFPPLGEGDIDFPVIFEALSKGGYKGPISAEIEVTGKGVIPEWLVSDEKEEIVSAPKETKGPEFIDRALAVSLKYLTKVLNI
jgi:sugar phosphate isomerase/epimerase